MRNIVFAVMACLLVTQVSSVRAADQPLPQIPGITARDMFPGGCVDCHRVQPGGKQDFRLSTYIEKWTRAVDAKVLKRVQAIAPKGAKLSGKHPPMAAASFRDVPKSCGPCHASPRLPQMGPMMHALHLKGGRENHFLTLFKGACTHCHKLDGKTARWSIPSLPER